LVIHVFIALSLNNSFSLILSKVAFLYFSTAASFAASQAASVALCFAATAIEVSLVDYQAALDFAG
jgi:hypothetical protein